MSAAGKPSSAGAVPGVHEQIRLEAAAVGESGGPFFADPGEFPALLALLDAAMKGIEAATPASIEYEGRRYWLRLRIAAADLGIHDAPGESRPLVRLMTEGRWSGHKPGH